MGIFTRLEENKRVHAEVKLPLILIHTPFGLTLFDRIAKTSAGRAYARFNTYIMPLITALAMFLIVGSLMLMFSNAVARAGVRDIGPQANLLIPGLNPYLPITYGWIALIVAIVIHEAGHGIVARVYNVKVESTGIVLLVGLPIAAFVNIQKEELEKTPLKQKSAILTAGPLNNMILAGASLLALLFVVSTLTPLPEQGDIQYGVQVLGVNGGSIAESIGIKEGFVIQTVAGQEIRSVTDLGNNLRANLGNTVEITWLNENGQSMSKSVALPDSAELGKGILGVLVTALAPDASQVLDRYKGAFGQNPLALLLPPTLQQDAVPYSDLMAPKYESDVFGPSYSIVANVLFWIWFVNFNVGIFNALPIGPLDGGQFYGALIDRRAKSKVLAKNATMFLTIIMTGIVVASFIMPYLLF
jgi:membrane-associated protease RseP (regulator of RpoE activity)